MLILGWTVLPASPSIRMSFGTVTAVLLAFGIPLSFLQHAITSDLTRIAIERLC